MHPLYRGYCGYRLITVGARKRDHSGRPPLKLRPIRLIRTTVLAGITTWYFATAWASAEDVRLKPQVVRLGQECCTSALDVAWLNNESVLIASDQGVKAYSLMRSTFRTVITGTQIPEGLPHPDRVQADGETAVATDFASSQFACRARDGKRLFARSSPAFYVIDIAVWRDRLYVLGWPTDRNGVNNPSGTAVWTGAVVGQWDQLSPLHVVRSGPEAVAICNDSVSPYGGGLALENDGTVDVITAAEAGVFRYAPTGRLIQVLGQGLGELVIKRMHDVNFTFGRDFRKRYSEILNVQPIADDLVATADGPAILVRLAKGNSIHWELWYPDAERLRARLGLGLELSNPYAHLACAARGRRLACVYSEAVSEAKTSSPSARVPYLALFELPRVSSSDTSKVGQNVR